MLSWKDFHVQEQVRNDRLAEAKQARLVKSVSSERGSSLKKVSSHLRGLVGSRLVSWGDNLQNRRADMSLVSRSQSSQSNL